MKQQIVMLHMNPELPEGDGDGTYTRTEAEFLLREFGKALPEDPEVAVLAPLIKRALEIGPEDAPLVVRTVTTGQIPEVVDPPPGLEPRYTERPDFPELGPPDV